MAHELNNPLAAVLQLSEELQAEVSKASPDHAALETITEAETVLGNARVAAEPAMSQTGVRLEINVVGKLTMLTVDRAG